MMQSLLILIAVCLNGAAIALINRNRAQREGAHEWPRHPAVHEYPPAALALFGVAACLLVAGGALFFV